MNRTLTRLCVALLVLTGGALGGYAQAMSTMIPAEGTITAIKGSTITLTQADNMTKTITLQDKTVVLMRQVVGLDQIKAGDAMGVASRRGSDGSLVAVYINIFAPEMWSSPLMRKGEFPMQTGDTMTNAVVTQYATGVKGRVITMKYAEGTSTITVPDGTQIHKLVVAKPSALTTGLKVQIRGSLGPNGTIMANSISFDAPAKG
jgi:Domain of unknown function (DUF5666)